MYDEGMVRPNTFGQLSSQHNVAQYFLCGCDMIITNLVAYDATQVMSLYRQAP